ncbi:MAG: hypothetical protein DRO04_02030 [Candidatus Iainarchaeum archaeon]|uniref:Uncharacterized protein n=1 Tax=Candidatus Iainarchaeum sp. TaxID=3101447 RepID=A0A497JGU8_9ARCH|nr:MAG: hypothetical protein DRO04_02030 [Candidatus Diapherotrites archaeon]
MKISKECKEQIKKLLEEFFEYNMDEKDVEEFIYCIQSKETCFFNYGINKYYLFNWLVYDQIHKIWIKENKPPFTPNSKPFKLYEKYCNKEKVKELYNKIATLIAYHNKDYDYLANKITNLLSSL